MKTNGWFEIRTCRHCESFLPYSAKICSYCNKVPYYEESDKFKNLTFKETIDVINSAFFRLEKFGEGFLKEYLYFGFNDAFTTLLANGLKIENYTIENCNLLKNYWKLAATIEQCYDTNNFVTEAFDNLDFCKDINEISILSFQRMEEFRPFHISKPSEEWEINSITDVIRENKSENNSKGIQSPNVGSLNFETKPHLNVETATIIYDILEKYFDPEQKKDLKHTLRTGNDSPQKLVFKSTVKRLADTFKQLIEHHFITGCEKQDLQTWIVNNFMILEGKEPVQLKYDTVKNTISRHTTPCKNPLIDIREGQIYKVDTPIKKKVNKY